MGTAGGRAVLRRRAAVRLGLLGGLMLVAGVLPWATAGPLAARLFALPLLLVGVVVGAGAVRVRRLPLPAPRSAYPAPAAEPAAGCGGCDCGSEGCGGSG